jgi:hypothetical protein
LTVRLWSGSPTAIALRPQSAAPAEEPALPALLMVETAQDKPCLMLPPRSFHPSRILRTVDAVPERRFRLTRLLRRGADFERVAFEEMQGTEHG